MVFLNAAPQTKGSAFRQSFHPHDAHAALDRNESAEVIRVVCRNAQRTPTDFARNEGDVCFAVKSITAQIVRDRLDHRAGFAPKQQRPMDMQSSPPPTIGVR